MLPVIVALDFQTGHQAFEFLEMCDPKLCRVKIGKGMFTRLGGGFVRQVIAMGYDVFLDLKFHDIPNTVYDACRAAVDLGVWMLNVHALGGLEMMLKAREAVDTDCQLIAVTILTSMLEADLKQIGFSLSLDEAVSRLAQLAEHAEFNGVVSSSWEAPTIKSAIKSKDFKIVAPGIRLSSDISHDQKRVMTPKQALAQGVDYLVIGRSITHAESPKNKLGQIQLDIAN